MSTKVCSNCKREKKLDSFGKYSRSSDGLMLICKICHNEYQKRVREKKNINKEPNNTYNQIHLTGLGKRDYCLSYIFLSKMGYNIEEDIHLQFTKKYGLEYKSRPTRNKKLYSFGECLDCSNETDSFT
jgi:hypothetical protein